MEKENSKKEIGLVIVTKCGVVLHSDEDQLSFNDKGYAKFGALIYDDLYQYRLGPIDGTYIRACVTINGADIDFTFRSLEE